MRREGAAAEFGTESPRAVLDFIAAHQGSAIFHLKDFHEPMRESAEIRRRLRDIYESCRDQRKFVVITSPVRFIPEEIERSIMFLELRPPDLVELVDFVREDAPLLAPPQPDGAGEALLDSLARALLGLTLDEARYALRRALAANPRLGPGLHPASAGRKAAAGEPQRRHRVCLRWHQPGRGRRSGRAQEMADGAPASCFRCAIS